MKKVLIEFKEPINDRHYCTYYKMVSAFLTKFHIKRLQRKKCWDITIVEDDREDEKNGVYNHIPRID